MDPEEKIWSRSASVPLRSLSSHHAKDNRRVVSHVECAYNYALQRAEATVAKLEQKTGKRAVDRLYETQFVPVKNHVNLRVRITFYLA
uniref:Uncharacterized protein n=1 Tax=Pseudomonas phage HRDY3 TaxID=3236930 RepID=A0AB39CES9_9VIRU